MQKFNLIHLSNIINIIKTYLFLEYNVNKL